MTKRLYILGYGICPSIDRPAVFDAIADRADSLLLLEPPQAAILDLLSKHSSKVQNYINLYETHPDRSEIYDQIVQEIKRNLQQHDTVAFVTEGNPRLLNTISERLEKMAKETAVHIEVVCAMSSIDKLICELYIPVGDRGLHVYTANQLVRRQPPLDRDAVLLLAQPGNVGSGMVTLKKVSEESVVHLRDTLLTYYGPDTKWMLVHLSDRPDVPSAIIWNRIRNLDQFTAYMHSGTLVVSERWWPSYLEGIPESEVI